MHATGSSALWGARVGFFVSSFSGTQLLLESKRKAAVKSLSQNPKDDEFLKRILRHKWSELIPFAGAGSIVGGMFGLSGGKFHNRHLILQGS